MTTRRLLAAASISLALTCSASAQGDSAAQSAIRATFTQWMTAFNAGDAEKACALFSPDLIAQIRGLPERGYAVACDVIKQSLSDPSKAYTYALDLKEILVSGDLAVARLTWTLKVRQKQTATETSYEEYSLDILRRQQDGSWKLVRFLMYDSLP
jgi:uncharacterized protein (TIGR02246 family)